MNERIKALYTKAVNHAFSVTTLNENAQEWQLLIANKFAELLIRECMREVIWVGRMNPATDEPMKVATEINQRITKHFGLE